ncbi:Hypothetical predicted protein [Pelobates cultripes]|uniref:Uncharacterized protein n=1 Tax=Pelobates cultripes TaxID=61616 RepID=A0AAD1TE19_PELCU|nr:Hypothetical predicted protein [Pelobates cultripes]
MAHQRGKKATPKPDKLNFFGGKSFSEPEEQASPQDGGRNSGELAYTNTPLCFDTDMLTKSHFQQALDSLSNKLITSWQHTADSLRKDIQELGKCTSHVENKLSEFATAHNDLASHVEAVEHKMLMMEHKITDLEDRMRRNNLRIRGIPEDVAPDHLQAYIRGMFKKLAPDIPSDMLLLDRVHRMPRPKFLPALAPRDTLLRVHYYHVKDLLLKTAKRRTTPLENYPQLKIFADLSATTLNRRKEFAQVITTLRAHGLRFRWGFPTKVIVTKDNTTQVITSPEEGLRKLQTWGFLEQTEERTASSSKRLQLDWHTT